MLKNKVLLLSCIFLLVGCLSKKPISIQKIESAEIKVKEIEVLVKETKKEYEKLVEEKLECKNEKISLNIAGLEVETKHLSKSIVEIKKATENDIKGFEREITYLTTLNRLYIIIIILLVVVNIKKLFKTIKI